MSAPDQWTALGSSVGPDFAAEHEAMWRRQREAGPDALEETEPTVTMPLDTYHAHINGAVRCGRRLERAAHTASLDAQYRRGRLDGFVRLGLAVVGLAGWAWVVGRGR